MRRLLAIWRRHPALMTGFVAALVLTLFFSARMMMFSIYWSNPMHRDQTLAGWMTPRYVAHSWRVDPDLMRAAIGPVQNPDRRRNLADIAAEQGIPLADLIARIQTAISASREAAQ